MEGDEDEPLNVNGYSLQSEDHLVSNLDECVEFHSSEILCGLEVLPLSSELQSAASGIAEKTVEVDEDSVMEKRDLGEETKIGRGEVVGDFLEDMVGDIKEKVETCVSDESLERQNFVLHLAEKIEVKGMGVFNVMDNPMGETFAVEEDDVQEKAYLGIFPAKEETKEIDRAEAIEETTMTDAAQDIESVYVTNIAEETVIRVKGEVTVLSEVEKDVETGVVVVDELKDTSFAGFGYSRDADTVNILNATNAELNWDVQKETEEARSPGVTDNSLIIQDMETVYVINVAEDTQAAGDGDVSVFEKGEEINQASVTDEDTATRHTYMVDSVNDIEEVCVANVMETTVAVEGKVPEVAEDVTYLKDEFSALTEFELAAPLQDTEHDIYTAALDVTRMQENIVYAMDDVVENRREDEMENMAAYTAEDEVNKMADDIVDIGAVDMGSVEDEAVESDEMDVYVTDMAADGAEEMVLVDDVEAAAGSKRKHEKNSEAPARIPSRKKVEEDVCFICFDGGDLVLCDRRGCPKAYHPSCVNRDEAFFRAKGRWNCGWHLCSTCGKTANYMCFTCTFSLCKSCIKDAIIFCVRGNKGFCETCMKMVTLIEKNHDQVDFNDKSSWEYLFKDYWSDIKRKLSLTNDELTRAKVAWKGSEMLTSKHKSPNELDVTKVDRESDSHSSGNFDSNVSKRKRPKKLLKSPSKNRDSSHSSIITSAEDESTADRIEWASKELLNFIMHMRNGDKSVLSHFDVQALLLEYITRNKLRDPRRKSQIVCDIRLENLFGKPRVGHFEMLKLLESHFLIKEDSQADDLQGSVVDTQSSQMEVDENTDVTGKARKDRKRKARKKTYGRGLQYNVDDYAAIDCHNINLIYLKRNLLEELIDDMDNFHAKVVGTFVRIRISGSAQKQDLYRLVQVVGTCKAGEPYKVGKKMTNMSLEILNLNKKEIISSDTISNQEFTEDECKRLRQSIKCGLLSRLTVGDIQVKAMALQEVRVKDWLEAEIVRLSHLRDRASEKGHRKEECVEKLQRLKTPEERQRRLEEIAEIHSDPNMDPSHESEEEEEKYSKPRGNNGFGRRTKEPISPRKGGSTLSDDWSGTRNISNPNKESNRNFTKGYSNKTDDGIGSGEIKNDYFGNQGREMQIQRPIIEEKQQQQPYSPIQSRLTSHLSSARDSQISAASLSTVATQSDSKIDEAEKIWHYKDPSGKVQGPFSIVQLRKWSTTGYFPADLRIWRSAEKEFDSLLLTDAMAGKFQNDLAEVVQKSNIPSYFGKSRGPSLQQSVEIRSLGASESYGFRNKVSSTTLRVSPSVEASKYSTDGQISDYGIRTDSINLPSPTPSPRRANQRFSQQTTPISEQPAVFVRDSVPKGPQGQGNSMRLGSFNTFHLHSESTGAAPSLAEAALNPSADIESISANLHSLVQSLNSRSAPPVQTEGWGAASVLKPEMTASGPIPTNDSKVWGSVPSYQAEPGSNMSSIPAQLPRGQWGDPQASFPATPMTNPPPSGGGASWRPPVQSSQPNMQAPAIAWGTNQGNPNIVWAGPIPTVANLNWAAQRPSPRNVNQGWAAPSQGPTPGNAVPSWGTYNQPPPPSVNGNASWIALPGNVGMGGNEQREWGRQPSFKGQRVCKFHESGHCKKGAACDYLHT